MREVGDLIVSAIREREDERGEQTLLSERVRAICARFPVPGLAEE